MKVHARLFLLQRVSAELSLALAKFMDQQDEKEPLTMLEWLSILNDVCRNQMNRMLADLLRDERQMGETKTDGA